MLSHGGRSLVLGLVLQAGLLTVAAADTQLYEPRTSLYAKRVTSWARQASVVPEAVMEGNWLLIGWGPNAVEMSGLALVQVSTGQTLWALQANPEEHLSGWLIDGDVHLSRYALNADTVEHQILDPATGAIRHSVRIPIGPDTTVLQFLTSDFIAGHKEVFDGKTAQRRGALPDEVDFNQIFLEISGRLFGRSNPDPQTGQRDFLEIDLGSLQLKRRWNLATLFPDHPNGSPILCGDHHLIVDLTADASSRSLARSLAAVSLADQQIAWQIEVAPQAPLLFVDDLAASVEVPPQLSMRPLLVEWSTGKHQPGEPPLVQYDLVEWALPDRSRTIALHEFEDGFAAHVERRNGNHALIGLDREGHSRWRRDVDVLFRSTPEGPQRVPPSLTLSPRMAVIGGAYRLELVDLQTGAAAHYLTPESSGFVSKLLSREETGSSGSAAGTSSSPRPSTRWKVPDRLTIPVIALALLLVYAVVRRLALRPRGSPANLP